MDDYRWLQHGCRCFDRAAVEDGIEQTVLTPDATTGGAAGRATSVAGQVPQGRRRRVPQQAAGVRGVVEEDLHQAVRRAAWEWEIIVVVVVAAALTVIQWLAGNDNSPCDAVSFKFQ
jgi:hypothetical protein|uniref:Uncharacterized protein n=1 Tax=Zea mays TaxID=4577 RepID=A0A804Q9F4_MAIZE